MLVVFTMLTCIISGIQSGNNGNSAGGSYPSDVEPCHPDGILCDTQRGYSMPCNLMPHSLPLSGEHHTVLHIQYQNKLLGVYKSRVFHIKQVFNLILTKYNASSSHTAMIICMKPAPLRFENIVNLVVKHLSMLYCGYPVVRLNTKDKI